MQRKIRSFPLVVVALLAASVSVAGEEFQVDPAHSSVTFRIRHLVSRVSGQFNDFAGTIQLDRDTLTNSSVEFRIEAASIDTANQNRDAHLRNEDFFHVAKYPEMTFQSTRIERASSDTSDVTGRFSMHGVTRLVTIPVEFHGIADHPRFGERAGFSTSFTLDRKDYGIDWNMPMGTDALVLGDEVQIQIDIEAVKIPPKPAGEDSDDKAES